MEIKPVDNRMYSLVVLYDMQSTFFISAIDGISDHDAHNRLNTRANHVAWLTGSLVEQRYDIARMLGLEMTQAAHDLFKDHQGIKDDVTYPSLIDYRRDWDTITPLLKNELVNASEEKLNITMEMMPGESYSNYEMITFMIYREANCIGQIALWRRLLGYDAMKYM